MFWEGGDNPIQEDNDDDYPLHSSTTNRPLQQPGQPGGTGEDPMVLAAMQSVGYLRLEGNPPDRFNGDCSRTCHFLTQFCQFMLMNDGAMIAQNDIKKCTYFLLLLEGLQVEVSRSDHRVVVEVIEL